jgi:hypothetical protein
MNEQDLREAMRSTILTATPPPPMDSATVLASARRSRIRGTLAWTGAGGTTLAALLAVTVYLGGSTNGLPNGLPFAGPRQAPTPTVAAPSDTGTKPVWPNGPDGSPQQDRTARAGSRYDRGVQLLDALISAVPTGFVVPVDPSTTSDRMPARSHQAQFEDRVNGAEVWSYLATAAITRDGRTGRLVAEVHTPGNTLPSDPCALAVSFWGMGGECQIVTVNTPSGPAAVGVAGGGSDGRFDQWAAYRHADGTVVFIGQAIRHDENSPALDAPPYQINDLAGLAADARFHLA